MRTGLLELWCRKQENYCLSLQHIKQHRKQLLGNHAFGISQMGNYNEFFLLVTFCSSM